MGEGGAEADDDAAADVVEAVAAGGA